MNLSTEHLVAADKQYLWHPFTPMRQWCDPAHEPVVLCRGEGIWLFDTRDRRYLDGNSSIWTNIHGHCHPRLLEALQHQSRQLCHSSFLGATNPPAIQLAEALINRLQPSPLTRLFYSDNGSTAIEVAIKMACQYFQLLGQPRRSLFLAFQNAYHGDTMGASSLGGVSLFFDRFKAYQFPAHQLESVTELHALPEEVAAQTAAVVIEPLVQGVAGMKRWPPGTLQALRAWCDQNGALLIFDEVLTGFGRTGTLLGCQHEGVWPDFLALAKGLTGGLMPLAATLTTTAIYEAFLGDLEEQKTFYYGHSYTGNPLACAVALESLRLIDETDLLTQVQSNALTLHSLLHQTFHDHPHVAEIRQTGLITGLSIVRDRANPADSWAWTEQIGARICAHARSRGLLTRNILDVITFLPPLVIDPPALNFAVEALHQSINAITRP